MTAQRELPRIPAVDTTLYLIIATLVFLGIHVLPSTPLRGAAVRAVEHRLFELGQLHAPLGKPGRGGREVAGT